MSWSTWSSSGRGRQTASIRMCEWSSWARAGRRGVSEAGPLHPQRPTDGDHLRGGPRERPQPARETSKWGEGQGVRHLARSVLSGLRPALAHRVLDHQAHVLAVSDRGLRRHGLGRAGGRVGKRDRHAASRRSRPCTTLSSPGSARVDEGALSPSVAERRRAAGDVWLRVAASPEGLRRVAAIVRVPGQRTVASIDHRRDRQRASPAGGAGAGFRRRSGGRASSERSPTRWPTWRGRGCSSSHPCSRASRPS